MNELNVTASEAEVWSAASPASLLACLYRAAGWRMGMRIVLVPSPGLASGFAREAAETLLAQTGPAGEVILAVPGRADRAWQTRLARQGLWLSSIDLRGAGNPFAPVAVSLGADAVNQIARRDAPGTASPSYAIAAQALEAEGIVSISSGTSPLRNLARLAVGLPPEPSWAAALDCCRILRYSNQRGEMPESNRPARRMIALAVAAGPACLGGIDPVAVEIAARRFGWWQGGRGEAAEALALSRWPPGGFGASEAVSVRPAAQLEVAAA